MPATTRRKAHRADIVIDPHWGDTRVHMNCPWEPNDLNRPCYPVDESGNPYPEDEAVEIGCIYAEYMEEHGIQSFRGAPITLTIPVRSIWNGDAFEFYVGDETEEDPFPS